MITVLNHIFSTPFIWPSLGTITAIGIFVGPLLYNGDLKAIWKAILCLGVFGTLAGLVLQTHAKMTEQVGFKMSLQPYIFITLVGMAYISGLLIGISIFKMVHKK